MCMEMDEFPWARCSLDGYNEKENFGMEIKYVGKDAMGDVIPPHHYAQVQHQIMVSGVNDILYLRSNDKRDEKGDLIVKKDIVKRDEPFIKNLFEQEKKFWDMVVNKIEPPKPERKKRAKKAGLGASA